MEASARPVGTVTFLLTDIEGSTRSWDSDPASMRRALARHDEILNETIATHRGHVLTERGEGDSFFAIFAEAADALQAALAAQLALAREDWSSASPIRVRMSLHTGTAGRDHRGPDVNRCARIRSLAHGGQVLISDATRTSVGERLPDGAGFRDLGEHRLKDLARAELIHQLTHPGLPADFPPLASLDAFRHNLPIQLSSFVGREDEIEDVRTLIEDVRLVTLLGTGGAGKTRLALQVGSELVEQFSDGVRFVALGPLREGERVISAIATVLNVAEERGRPLEEGVLAALHAHEVLLILDNCEHVLAEAARITQRILEVAPRVRVLTTSREPLRLPGEVEYRVAPLSLPFAGPLRLSQIESNEAVRLFMERARAVRRGFSLTEENASTIVSICARLDGIPLAIELASARLRSLSLEEIARRLADRFRLLVGGSRAGEPRQQTLRGAIDWSHDLLTEAEAVVFRRVSAFAGSFDVEAAESVAGAAPVEVSEVGDALASLVERSMVVSDVGGDDRMRYGFHESLREYASERLNEARETTTTRDRHLAFMVSVAERAHAGRIDAAAEWLQRLDDLQSDIEPALAWALERDADLHLQLAGAVAWYWSYRSQLRRGADRLVLALDGRGEASPHVARALSGLALLAGYLGRMSTGLEAADRAVRMWRDLGEEREAAAALEAKGYALFFGGEPRESVRTLREALQLQEEVGDPVSVNRSRLALCQALVGVGEVEEVEALATAALERAREGGRVWEVMEAHHFLGDCALAREDPETALHAYSESLRIGEQLGDLSTGGFNLQGVGMALAGLGYPEKALRLEGAALAIQRRIGLTDEAFWRGLRERWFGRARRALGTAAAEAALAEGGAMSPEHATRYALTALPTVDAR